MAGQRFPEVAKEMGPSFDGPVNMLRWSNYYSCSCHWQLAQLADASSDEKREHLHAPVLVFDELVDSQSGSYSGVRLKSCTT
jgi:hypothetical protein